MLHWKYLLLSVLLLIFILQLFYFYHRTRFSRRYINLRSIANDKFNHSQEIPGIYLLDRFTSSRIQKTNWEKQALCLVPLKMMPLINGLYGIRGYSSITYIPCSFFNSSKESLQKKRFQCRYGLDTIPNHSTSTKAIECLQSQTMDVFLQENASIPSFLINRYPLTDYFMRNILQKYYRTSTNVWGFSFHDESIGYYPWAGNRDLLNLFDITEGYDRNLYHLLIPSYFPRYYHQLIVKRTSSSKVLKDKKNRPVYVNSSILYINSNCYPPSGRGKFMEELMKHIQVDSWGYCHRNRYPHQLPKEILRIHGKSWDTFHYYANWTNSKMAMARSYLFTVAIENTIHYDYVTEKFWQPLAAGSVPLYLGAPNINDWAPGENSFIDLRHYSTPKHVADLIKNISSNITLYMQYHTWRDKPLAKTFRPILDYYRRTRNYSLECLICDLIHHRNSLERRSKIIQHVSFSSNKSFVMKV